MKPVLNDLNKALTYQLEGMYDAEKRLQKFIPGYVKLATSRALKAEFKNYLESTADKRTKLKRIFSYLLAGPFGRKNKAVDKMLKDAKDFAKFASVPQLRDVILIASLQDISQYKISSYTTAKAFAMELGLDQVFELLSEILAWEKNTNESLSKMALKGMTKKVAAISMA